MMDWFQVDRGWALSPFLFAAMMDRMTDEIRQETPWIVMFVNDIVMCVEIREQVETSLERYALITLQKSVCTSHTLCLNSNFVEIIYI